MANGETTLYAFIKPEVGAAADAWGGLLNNNLDDLDALSGALATAGSANAYTLSTGLSLAAYASKQRFLVRWNHTNNGSATLNVDGLGAKTIKKRDGSTNVASGDLVSNQYAFVAYDGTNFVVLGLLASETQPIDATLTAFAALSFAADKLAYGTGTDAFALADFTSYARSLVATANLTGFVAVDGASAWRTALGLGTAAVVADNTLVHLAGTETITGAKTFSADVVMNGGAGALTIGGFTATVGADIVTLSPSNIGAGNPGLFINKSSTAALWNISLYDTVDDSGTINFGVDNLTLVGVAVLTTTTGMPKTGGTFTGDVVFNGGAGAISVGGFASNVGADILTLVPNDHGSGKPGLYINKPSTAAQWNIALYDQVNNAGTIIVACGAIEFSGSVRGRKPLSSETSGTLTSASANKRVKATGGVTINDGVFTAEDDVEIYNDSDSSITITQDTGMTLRLGGVASTTGNRTLAARGIAYVYFDTNADAAVGGTGVS